MCSVRRRSAGEQTNTNLPEFIVEPVCTFTTDFYISGIAALDESSQNKSKLNLILLGYAKELDEEGNAKRPTLQIVEPTGNDYIEV